MGYGFNVFIDWDLWLSAESGAESMKPKTYKKNQIIEIEWDDIITDAEWLTEVKCLLMPIPACKTVGYFLFSDKQCIRLSHSIQEKDRDITLIPWGVIKKIRRLK